MHVTSDPAEHLRQLSIGGNQDRLFEIKPYCIILDGIDLKAVGLCVIGKWKKRWVGYLYRIVLNEMRIFLDRNKGRLCDVCAGYI